MRPTYDIKQPQIMQSWTSSLMIYDSPFFTWKILWPFHHQVTSKNCFVFRNNFPLLTLNHLWVFSTYLIWPINSLRFFSNAFLPHIEIVISRSFWNNFNFSIKILCKYFTLISILKVLSFLSLKRSQCHFQFYFFILVGKKNYRLGECPISWTFQIVEPLKQTNLIFCAIKFLCARTHTCFI